MDNDRNKAPEQQRPSLPALEAQKSESSYYEQQRKEIVLIEKWGTRFLELEGHIPMDIGNELPPLPRTAIDDEIEKKHQERGGEQQAPSPRYGCIWRECAYVRQGRTVTLSLTDPQDGQIRAEYFDNHLLVVAQNDSKIHHEECNLYQQRMEERSRMYKRIKR